MDPHGVISGIGGFYGTVIFHSSLSSGSRHGQGTAIQLGTSVVDECSSETPLLHTFAPAFAGGSSHCLVSTSQ